MKKIIKMLHTSAVCLACFTLALSFTSCKKSGENNTSENDHSSAESNTVSNSDIKLRSYKFPDFLSGYGEADMLSHSVYSSFDSAATLVEPESQPFDDYKCTAFFNDSCYIYTENSHYGILGIDGSLIYSADTVNKISAVSPNMLKLKIDDGSTQYVHADFDGVRVVTPENFDSSRISFTPDTSSESGESSVYTMKLDGVEIYDADWSNVTELEKGKITTEKRYSAAYKATSASGEYYIVFDRYYNFTVYEAAYGFVSLKIGGEYGEGYIFGGKDYSELKTLIDSFGNESIATLPSKDESSDYIRFTLGLLENSKTVLTFSADGFCLTDNDLDDEGVGDKYFTLVSRETFPDLVNWVDTTLRQ